MKTLYLGMIVLSMSGLLAGASNSVFAPCLIGVTSCGLPPGVTVSVGPDSQFYEKNDTIHIQGQVYVQNYTKPIEVKIVNPDNVTIQSIDTPVTDGKFGLKIVANFDTTGYYQIITCLQGRCDMSGFKFVSEPYPLTVNGQDFFIKYKSSADLVGMDADTVNHVLRVHITNATAQGLQFVIEIPRTLVDSTGYGGKNSSIGVLIGMHQPDEFMQFVNFTELSNNNLSRTLAIDIPYEPVPNSSGTWDLKIVPVDAMSKPIVFTWPPLQQIKSGISTNDIACNKGLYLAIKSYNSEPACLKAGTISKLASRGFFYGIDASENQVNYTTVLIPPGSENQASHNTYSPSIVTVVIGVNNTVRWVSQSETANTIVSDMPLIQNGKSFGSNGIIKPGGSYMFTFTEPGTFAYHTEPHPWMKGTVTVLSQSTQITSVKTNDPFGITALIIYHPPDLCLNPSSHSIPAGMPSCPPNKFYLKINSNSTAYLMGYHICDDISCATNNNLSLILPLNAGLNPDYQMIGLPVNLQWKYGDTVGIQLYVSSTNDNKTASLVDLGNSSIVP